tara:strand:- start:731 stop:1129 length:399 start_codon:yes stop_codon:yes gene_type:complete
MISGISVMMQIGNNLNNLMLLSTFKRNEYYQSALPSYDRKILELLYNYSGPNSEVCTFIKENLNDNLYEDGEIFLSTGTQTPSNSSLLFDSCVLVNKELNHRILIKKNTLESFSLFSCYLKNETFCPYEANK